MQTRISPGYKELKLKRLEQCSLHIWGYAKTYVCLYLDILNLILKLLAIYITYIDTRSTHIQQMRKLINYLTHLSSGDDYLFMLIYMVEYDKGQVE